MSTIDAGAPVSSETAGAPRSLGRRILDTFVSPGELFSRLGPTPPWVDVLLIAAALTTLAMALIPASVWMNMAHETIANMEPKQRAAVTPETIANVSRITGPLGAFFVTFVTAFIVAGLLKLVFGVFMKGEATFAEYRSVVSHAALISALGTLVTLPVWIATGDITTQLSAGLLAPELPKGVLSSLLGALSVFGLWWMAVIAMGVSTVNRRISFGASAGIIFGIYLAVAALAGLVAAR